MGRRQRYAAFIRGVNVGGTTLAMADLRSALEADGFDGVATYVQSGNAVFSSDRAADDVGEAIEGVLRQQFSLEVPVIVRSSRQLEGILTANPLLIRSEDPTKLHVTFLGSSPSGARIAALEPSTFENELALIGQEVFLFCPNGYGRTKLTNTFIERKLGVVATTRNWRTLKKLAEMTRAG